ncbi:flap endonuclease GEN homolog 1-like [Amphibalanus amphitrite]|uniref:flap endonuclease GEN homolog 1-like n=1 Tax=Amphibalanus amphitrite TaxID=1232801 RepID=UPI001C90F94A|nr:flap endonuclease GEN homolog 1-like [Amphibalanus amphitrite]
MGVKGLWSVLESVGEPCPLSELAERTVAVDLSGWVVEAETAKALAGAVNQPYLRNLVYRTTALLLQHTLPVFVLDGAAPTLKLAEMARRQGGAATGGGRQQLRGRLRRCARLLDALGVPHVTSDGEAEALCARLDASGRVDGVVSDDVDAALFGARTLYRRLNAGKTGGEATRYSLQRVRDELGLDCQHLRELALLLGCDFLPAGLPGLGLQVSQQLVRRLDGRPLLPQLSDWLRQPPLSTMPAVGELGRAPSHCVRCGHPGTETRHRRDSCALCDTVDGCTAAAESAVCPCEWHRQRRNAEKYSAELKARDCARRCPEYEAAAAAAESELKRSAPLPECDITWRRPDLAQFTTLAGEELGWTEEQSRKVAAPLLARWQLRHGGGGGETSPLRAIQVVRFSKHHHIDCYLVRWRLDGCPEELETHEPRPLVEAALKPLIDAFLETKKPKKAAPRRPRKTKAAAGAGPQAKVATGSPSKLITDFFPIRKKAAPVVGKGISPSEAAASSSAGGTTPNPDPSTAPRRRAAGARHAMSPESPDLPRRGRAGDSPASTDSDDSSRPSEELDSDGSIADLSAIIDAITRTHIADDAVIVISDDDDDVLEVSECVPTSQSRARDPAELGTANRVEPEASSIGDISGKAAPSLNDPRCRLTSNGSAVVSRISKTACPTSGPGGGRAERRFRDGQSSNASSEGVLSPASPVSSTVSPSVANTETVSDSDSDTEYVPLFRRLALA